MSDEFAQPGSARYRHPIAPPGWAYFLHMRWLIFYQPHPQGIEVMGVIDGVRDLPAQLP